MILGLLGGVVCLTAAGILGWNYFSASPAPAKRAVPAPAVATAPKILPPKNLAATKIVPVPAVIPNLAPDNVIAAPTSDQNLDDLMKALKSPDAAIRRHAASVIYNLGPAAQDALPVLPAALADTDLDVRMWAALALVHNNVYEKATIPILVLTLHHENPTLRQVACLSLAMIPYTDADKEAVIPALVDTATKDANPDVANDAMTALKMIAPDLVIGK